MKKDKKTKKANEKKYYVMFGFEEENPENTAYLKIDSSYQSGYGIYHIVNSAKYATKFPAKNYSRKKGFGTPYDWAEFFADEDELKEWNFHPVQFNPK